MKYMHTYYRTLLLSPSATSLRAMRPRAAAAYWLASSAWVRHCGTYQGSVSCRSLAHCREVLAYARAALAQAAPLP